MTVLFRPIQVMFNNVDMINVVTNSNHEERTIPLGYYTIDEIIVILSIMTDSTFSISTKVSSYGCIWIQFPHNRLHQCSGHSRNPRFGRTNGHSTCFVQWIECD